MRSRSVQMPVMGVWIFIRPSRLGLRQLEHTGNGIKTAQENGPGEHGRPNGMIEPLLRVRDLIVHLHSSSPMVLDRVGFDLAAGETIGILGESGAGKTTLAKALLRLLPAGSWQVKGSIRFRGSEILDASPRE